MNNMNILKDMELFVRVVQCDGLAAAGRELGMSPSSVTMRIKKLEDYYQAKLLTRTTRNINLTEQGRQFFTDSLRMLDQLDRTENKLRSARENISGVIRITVASDLGRQHIAPLIDDFVDKYPNVQPYLYLSDSVLDITENNIDIALRYGISPDSQLIAQKLTDSHRVLCASPDYIERNGVPRDYTGLSNHACLSMVQIRTPMTKWFFQTSLGEKSINITPVRSCDDGAQVREWAVRGAGIALKSLWDVADDLKTGRLVTLLDDQQPDYQSKKLSIGSDLYVAYPNRDYMPKRTKEFIIKLKEYFASYSLGI